MATHIRDNTSADAATEIVDGITAALQADPETVDLAPTWVALVARGDALATSLRSARRGVRRARAVVAVRDAVWDTRMKKMDRELLTEASGHRDSPTYVMFFGRATANDVTRWGVDREVEFGRDVIAKLGEPTSPLGSRYLAPIREATDQLATASTARRDAVRVLAPLFGDELLFNEDVNAEIDRLEGQLQIRFPRDPKRVASYLAATKRDDTGVSDASPDTSGGSAPPAAAT